MNLRFNAGTRMRFNLIVAATAVLFSAPAVASSVYWSLFNIEGESAVSAQYVTYNTLMDMLLDTNRVSNIAPDTFSAGRNVIGSGASIRSR